MPPDDSAQARRASGVAGSPSDGSLDAGTVQSAPPIGTLELGTSCMVLFVLAVSAPVLDLLGRNPEFFLARNAPTIDIAILAVLLAVVIPLGVAVVVAGVTRIHRGVGAAVHGGIFALLGTVLGVQIIQRTPLETLTGWLQIALTATAGVALLVTYRRSPALRSVMTWGAFVPLLVLGLFLFGSSTSQLVVGSNPAAAATPAHVGNPAPVVFMIFDELPVSSLMDGDGDVQDHLYPNFARLAEDGTWYRNAVTVRHQTTLSIPTIVSGLEASQTSIPTLRDHPDNLFTLLQGAYEITATEVVTRLCPVEACGESPDHDTPATRRWSELISDLRVISGHLFLPEDMTTGLPAIDHAWADFDAGHAPSVDSDEITSENFREWFRAAAADEDRQSAIDRFVESIDAPSRRPPLYFLHTMLPHAPWVRLPNGQFFDMPEPLPGRVPDGWVDDAWLVDQVYQLHLLQVQYADTVIGAVIERLEELEIYDDTLIVVVADHGIVIRPGMARRASTEESVHDIPPVPLIVKAPHQASGGIDDYHARTTDIIPTVADLLDIDLPWAADGTSLVSENRPVRSHSEITSSEGGIIQFELDGSRARDRAREKEDRFGPVGPFGLAPQGHADLLDVPVDDLLVGPRARVQASLESPDLMDNVDTTAEVLPVMVRGQLDAGGNNTIIAVALNGRIEAVTRSYRHRRGATLFNALLPPDALRDGFNELDLFVVTGEGADRTFRPLDG